MSHKVLVLFLVVAVVCATMMSVSADKKPPKKCGKNEVWSDCNADCQPTCSNQKPKCHKEKCVCGCVCVKGMVRNAKGECVRPCECDC